MNNVWGRVWMALLLSAALRASALDDWKAEIEERGGTRVVVVRIDIEADRNQARVPDGAPERAVLTRLLSDESLRTLLSQAHALGVNYDGAGGVIHFVLLNMALASEWRGFEDSLLAHEFGHAWLNAAGFTSPRYSAGDAGCVGVHAGDVVQHVLIRREARRRGIDAISYWRFNLDKTFDELGREAASPEEPAPPCQRLARLALWVDAALAFTPENWEPRPRFLERMRGRYPELSTAASDLIEFLRSADLRELKGYRAAVERSLAVFERVYRAGP